jgi:tetratricopeptide (TPR) repeat protein
MAQKKVPAKSQTAKKSSKPVKKDADYWFNKGALVSTYGNNKAAVRYFQKAIALNPNFSRAYFSQGVSFGQLGEYPKAIAQINRALKMEPQNGLYYYGRGRVYLLSGDKTKAMEDFKKAADLGDEDALDYLDYISEGKN